MTIAGRKRGEVALKKPRSEHLVQNMTSRQLVPVCSMKYFPQFFMETKIKV